MVALREGLLHLRRIPRVSDAFYGIVENLVNECKLPKNSFT